MGGVGRGGDLQERLGRRQGMGEPPAHHPYRLGAPAHRRSNLPALVTLQCRVQSPQPR